MRISKEEVVDQVLHFLAGCGIVTFGSIFTFPVFLSAVVSLVTFGIRESDQHPDGKYGKGSIIDGFFWILGTGVGALIWGY